MPRVLSALIAAAALIAAPAAHASPPACQTINGGAVKCGEAGAMPFGWSPPADVVEQQQALSLPDAPETLSLIGILFALFALIALMPDFDGKWEIEDGEDDRRR